MTSEQHPHFPLDFSTREFLRMLPVVDHVRLRDWDRRGILPNNSSSPMGRGVQRRWGFGDVVSIAVFAFLAEVLPDLTPALRWTPEIADEILDLYAAGPDGDKCAAAPIYQIFCDGGEPPRRIDAGKVRTLAALDPWRPFALVSPGDMAIALYGEVDRILKERRA